MASSLVNNKYRITRRIGGGSFGEIYMGIGPNNEKVAVKFERHGTRCPQLRHEYKVYRELINCHGFCSVYHFGTQDNYNVMVMDLLGPSLEDLFNKCNRRFTLKTVLQIADQLLERVDTLHARHLIHRDIKPANFVIGVGDQAANVFCVDFGLSKRYRHPKNLQHIPHRDGRSLTGTPRYASINNHLGIEQSRRDDLESIGYVLIYFLKGSLPWQGLKAKNAQKKYRLILEKKQQVSIAQLCQGCPSQFAEFLAYTRSLKFDAKPDIPYLRKLFRDLYHAQGCASVPKLWDWDGMESDFMSGTGSVGGGAAGGPPPITLGVPQLTSGLRPTTAAAIANPNMDNDMMGGANDDLDDDYDNMRGGGNHDGRPNTAGPTMYRSSAQGAGGGQANTSSWGYSRDQQAPGGAKDPRAGGGAMNGGGGIADYGGGAGGADPNRRPHTAHGARAGFPSSGVYNGAPLDPKQQQQQAAMYNEVEGEESGDHVVAGARGMMRYRRNRASTLEGQQTPPTQQQQMQPTAYQNQAYPQAQVQGTNLSSNPNSGWATYQPGKPQSAGGLPQQQQQQQMMQSQSLRKPGGGAPTGMQTTQQGMGWPGFSSGVVDPNNSRPKSAGITGTTGGGLMSSLTGVGRPSSGVNGGGGVPQSSGWGAMGGGVPQQQLPQQQQQMAAQSANTLSYGSLKNRFLSGSTGSGKAAGVAPVSSNPAPNNGAAASGANPANKSKLFSLAR